MQQKKKYWRRVLQMSAFIFVACTFTTAPVFGQKKAKKDTLAVIRDFVQICNSYKKLPLHVNVSIERSAEVVTSPEDTTSTSAEFFITEKGTYIKMDELEQVVSDSLLLFISNNAKRMILYPNKSSAAAQLNNYLGVQLQDSSLQKIAKKYTSSLISSNEQNQDSSTIELQSRSKVANTSLSKEIIQVRYNSDSKQPIEVDQVFRKLILLDSSTYNSLLLKPDYVNKLVSNGKNAFFLINTHTTRFIYRSIESNNDIELPVKIENCITKSPNNQYATTKKYDAFKLTKNF